MGIHIRKTMVFEVNTRFPHCDDCLDELEYGQGYYQLAGKTVCRRCLPRLAEALFLPWFVISGEEGDRF